MSFNYYLLGNSLEYINENLSYFFESDSINEEIYYINDYKPMDNMQQKSESNLHILSTKDIFIKEKGNNTKEIKLEKYQNNEHNNLLKTKEFKKGTNALGRKTKDSELKMIVNKSLKYRRLEKVKNIILKNLLNFINDKIKEIYNSNIGKGIFIKKLLSIKQKQKGDNFNKEFLDKSIGNIFSEDIRTNYTSFFPSHNKYLIELLLNEKDNNKRIYFNKLFNLTFRDALKYFRGSEDIEELNGMEKFGSKNKDIKNDENYLITLKYYVINFEELLGRKRIKRGKKKRKKYKR